MPANPESQDPERQPITPERVAAALFEILRQGLPRDISTQEKKKLFEEAQSAFSRAFQQKLSELEGSDAVRYGRFVAGRRIPAKRSGSLEGGRVHGLQWNVVLGDGFGIETLPQKLRNAIDKMNEEERRHLKGIEHVELPFIPGGVLWHLWFPRGGDHPNFDADAFAVHAGDSEPYFLNWTAEPINRLNRELRFRFSADLFTYIRFFFYMLRSDHGQPFTLVESESDLKALVPWDEEDPACKSKQEAANNYVQPIARAATNAKGEMRFTATVFFDQALFRCDIAIDPFGAVTMANDEPTVRDLPVREGSIAS